MSAISFSLRSEVGCVRANNEDMILLNGEFYRDESFEDYCTIHDYSRLEAIVADGMGGHEGGEFASELAVQAFDDFLMGLPDELTPEQVITQTKQWAQDTHQMITAKGLEMPQYAGMGTTFVGLFTYEGRVFMINIGDSRLYRYRNQALKQISEDHSMRNLTGDASQQSNLIFNSLGAGDSVFADVFDITERILPDDYYLICSDGVTDMLSDEQIDALLDEATAANTPSGVIVDQLVEAAKAAGGKDNISVIWLKFES